MTVVNEANAFRKNILGLSVSKSTGTLAATTVPLFTITGIVAVTSLVGLVTTAVTVANSYKLQNNPTIGTTADLTAAFDIGTTDTPAGEILVAELDGTALAAGGRGQVLPLLVLPPGQIEHVSAGTDGVILWRLTYVPISDGASIVAA
jgi:hypothetical protein